ncbi:MAG TPA: ABC transporter permease subunit [Puia sp.]|jgi:NitT/TauT family transport system permease protein|nr:ABC transporter permease subunit [Puia sp.]
MFKPFEKINRQTFLILVGSQAAVALLMWQLTGGGLIPQPSRVLEALAQLSATRLFADNLLTSLLLTGQALFYSVVITLLFGYVSVIPFFQPVAQFIVKCRYLTLTGLIFIFTLLTRDGGQLKLSLLLFGIVPFLTTSFLSIIVHTPEQEFELCQTLGFNRWESLYEVIVVGKADQVFEVVRQNFAIAWMMITMVEGLNMSEGGIGTLMIKYNKYNDLPHVLALQLVILGLGLGFDQLLGVLRRWLFPYTKH